MRDCIIGSETSNQHHLKILPIHFSEIIKGNKTFEIRKNDRQFETGDVLVLEEYKDGVYTSSSCRCFVTNILKYDKGFGLKGGHVIMSINLISFTGMDLADPKEESQTVVIDTKRNQPHKTSEVICVRCFKRWYAVRPEETILKDLECINCGQGFVIETGEIINP